MTGTSDVDEAALLPWLRLHDGSVTDLSVRADTRRLLTVGMDGKIFVVPTDTEVCRATRSCVVPCVPSKDALHHYAHGVRRVMISCYLLKRRSRALCQQLFVLCSSACVADVAALSAVYACASVRANAPQDTKPTRCDWGAGRDFRETAQ